MNKTETITPKELKKILKLAIAIDVELGLYIAYSGRTITVDRATDWDSNKTKIYKFTSDDLEDITRIINAYAKLHKRRLKLH